MSSIPLSERPESKLDALSLAYQIRKDIVRELLRTFAFREKSMESFIRNMTSTIEDPVERENTQRVLRMNVVKFSKWLIEGERSVVMDLCRSITEHLRLADSIWPTYLDEFEARRVQLDFSMGYCNTLQDEFMFLAEILPSDKNVYTSIAKRLQHLFRMIKRLRASDNRFLKPIKKREKSYRGFMPELSEEERLRDDTDLNGYPIMTEKEFADFCLEAALETGRVLSKNTKNSKGRGKYNKRPDLKSVRGKSDNGHGSRVNVPEQAKTEKSVQVESGGTVKKSSELEVIVSPANPNVAYIPGFPME